MIPRPVFIQQVIEQLQQLDELQGRPQRTEAAVLEEIERLREAGAHRCLIGLDK